MKDKIKKALRSVVWYLNIPFSTIRLIMVLPAYGLVHLASKHCRPVVSEMQEDAIVFCFANMARYFGLLGVLLYVMDRYWFDTEDPLKPYQASQKYLEFEKRNRELEEWF